MDHLWILYDTRGARIRLALLDGSPLDLVVYSWGQASPGAAGRIAMDHHWILYCTRGGQASPGAAGRIAMDRHWILCYTREVRLRHALLAWSPWITIGSCIAWRCWQDRYGSP